MSCVDCLQTYSKGLSSCDMCVSGASGPTRCSSMQVFSTHITPLGSSSSSSSSSSDSSLLEWLDSLWLFLAFFFLDFFDLFRYNVWWGSIDRNVPSCVNEAGFQRCTVTLTFSSSFSSSSSLLLLLKDEAWGISWRENVPQVCWAFSNAYRQKHLTIWFWLAVLCVLLVLSLFRFLLLFLLLLFWEWQTQWLGNSQSIKYHCNEFADKETHPLSSILNCCFSRLPLAWTHQSWWRQNNDIHVFCKSHIKKASYVCGTGERNIRCLPFNIWCKTNSSLTLALSLLVNIPRLQDSLIHRFSPFLEDACRGKMDKGGKLFNSNCDTHRFSFKRTLHSQRTLAAASEGFSGFVSFAVF